MGNKHQRTCEINIPGDGQGIQVEYIKSFTSSELTVGNREVTQLACNSGSRWLERGNLKNIVNFDFKDMRDFCKLLNDTKIASIQTKKGKFVTSGSDKGNSIILAQGDLRVEIRHGERGGLTKPETEIFLQVEKSIVEFCDKAISSYLKISIKFDESIWSKYDGKYPISLQSLGKHIIILNGKHDEVITDVYIAQKSNVFQISPYSVLGDECDEKSDCLVSEQVDIVDGTIYSVKVDCNKLIWVENS